MLTATVPTGTVLAGTVLAGTALARPVVARPVLAGTGPHGTTRTTTRSPLVQRLVAVQAWIAAALDQAPPGRLRAVSICAGQGRDLIGVLRDHPRRGDVTARLVELDPRIAATARQLAADAGLTQVEVVTGDAAQTDVYAGLVPATLVLACGVFGNITDEDVARTIRCCAGLCATGGTVVWTRGRLSPTWSRRSANGSLRKTSSYWGCPSPGRGGELVRTGLPEPLAVARRGAVVHLRRGRRAEADAATVSAKTGQ